MQKELNEGVMIRALGKQKTGEKDVGKPPQFAGLSYLSLRFKIGEPSYRPTSI